VSINDFDGLSVGNSNQTLCIISFYGVW